jgi:hypothetical protein
MICANVWGMHTENGFDDEHEDLPNCDSDWDGYRACICPNCGKEGIVEEFSDHADIAKRVEALTAIGRLAHELGASIETSENIDNALAYCAARQERMDAVQLRTLDEARADANEDAAERTSKALCEAGECDHPECWSKEFTVLLGVSVRVYGHARVTANSAAEAAEIVRASATAQTGPWNSATDIDWSTANEPSILHVTDEETGSEEIGTVDLSLADDPNSVISAGSLADWIRRQGA